MKKFIIKTLGCKTNQIESALIAEIMTNAGYSEVTKTQEADYYILNSCSVTHIADSKNLSYLRRAKRENPKIITVLTGCMAQLEKDMIIKKNLADYVIGNYEKNDIVKILEKNQNIAVSDIFEHDFFRYEKIHQIHRTRASVKIQDGCSNRCSYCTIPFARGKNRSNGIENIIEQINLFAQNGYYETVLTGIHIGQWGSDFDDKKNLQELLEKIEETNINRYRLGSLNPLELNENFIEFLSKSKKFCPHFHLSLQSVCDKTLKNMNRHYSASQIFELVNLINSKFDKAFIGSDIIMGFPDETDEDFEITRQNLDKLNLSRIHVFPYSRRKGTIADTMPNQIPEIIKKERCKIIQEISDKKYFEFLKANIGTENEVIIEKNRDKKTNLLKGVTKNYINVLINDKDEYKDKLQKVYITGFSLDNTKLLANILCN